ncbi:hypothetical protein PRIPAC_74881 [Pristionchus pacificus]|uniref:Uncharacterized protein n=1 Tax=Pristionchus pacificus TaxID=54126 RepID=A0A2A6BFF0_PRIPA|nr:hypothetical protein PRIPAC_74881 [Pristionchus pacificus]|eukprot:PDM64531.1 hypothetical protein PRIPAC_52787 [Pristionchus pacificus]
MFYILLTHKSTTMVYSCGSTTPREDERCYDESTREDLRDNKDKRVHSSFSSIRFFSLLAVYIGIHLLYSEGRLSDTVASVKSFFSWEKATSHKQLRHPVMARELYHKFSLSRIVANAYSFYLLLKSPQRHGMSWSLASLHLFFQPVHLLL